jgi:sugar phosphate isomerase/epimerase
MNRREFLISGAVAAMGVAEAADPQAAFAFDGGGPMSPAINPVYLTGSLTDWPLAELAAAGYRGIELTPECLDGDAAWQKAAEKAGLRPLCVNAMHDLRPYLTGSLSDGVAWRRRATLDRLLKTLARMREMGIPYLIVAPSRQAENYQTPAEARASLLESLRELAAAGDTAILLQAAPFRLFTSAKEIAAIVDDAAQPNVAAALDIGHALLARESPAEAAATLGARLRYVSVHDADVRPGAPNIDRHLPLGSGSAKREDVLAAIGRRPWSVAVTAPDDPIEAAKGALKWVQKT